MYGLRPTTSARLGELERAHQERRKAHPGVPCDEPQVLRRCSARGCNPRTAGRLTCSIEAARGAPLRNARRNVGRGNLECRSSIRGFRFFGDDIRASAGASRGAFSQGRGLASACSPWMPVRRPALHRVGVYIRASCPRHRRPGAGENGSLHRDPGPARTSAEGPRSAPDLAKFRIRAGILAQSAAPGNRHFLPSDPPRASTAGHCPSPRNR